MQGKVLPMISVEDTGECIRQIFIDKKKFAKKTVGLVGHWATVDSYARMMTDILDGMTFTATKVFLRPRNWPLSNHCVRPSPQ